MLKRPPPHPGYHNDEANTKMDPPQKSTWQKGPRGRGEEEEEPLEESNSTPGGEREREREAGARKQLPSWSQDGRFQKIRGGYLIHFLRY